MSAIGRSLRSLAVLAVLGAAAGLYAWYGVAQKDKAEAARKDADERLFQAVAAEPGKDAGDREVVIQKLEVHNRGDTTVLEKTDEGWFIVAPLRFPADKVTVDSIVSNLQTARMKATIEEAPDEAALKKYGLSPPEFRVKAWGTVAGKAETLELEGGIENTFDGSVYLRRAGQKPIYAAEGSVRWTLQKSTLELRQKDVLSMLDEAKVTSLDVTTPVNAWSATRAPDKQWGVSARMAAKQSLKKTFAGEPSAFAAMLGGLKVERALAFPDDSAEARKRLGLDKPLARARIGLSDGRTVALTLGKTPGDAEGKIYVLRELGTDALLVEMNPSVQSHLERNPLDLREKTVLPFPREAVASLELRTESGARLRLEREAVDAGAAERWQLVQPVAGPTKPFKVATLLFTLGAFRGLDLVEEAPKDLKKYGLDGARPGATLFDAAGKSLGGFSIGKAVPGKGDRVYMLGSRNLVFEVESARLKELPTSESELLEVPLGDAGTVP